MDKRTVVVFDFDGTLTKHDTFIEFAIFSRGIHRFLKACILAFPWLLMWKLGRISSSKAKQKLFLKLYKGESKSRLEKLATHFNPPLKSKILNRLLYHICNNDTIYIISASIDIWVTPWAKKYGIIALCTESETNAKGILTGQFRNSNCIGKEKVSRILNAEPNRGAYRLIVYGNSNGDKDILQIADERHFVK